MTNYGVFLMCSGLVLFAVFLVQHLRYFHKCGVFALLAQWKTVYSLGELTCDVPAHNFRLYARMMTKIMLLTGALLGYALTQQKLFGLVDIGWLQITPCLTILALGVIGYAGAFITSLFQKKSHD